MDTTMYSIDRVPDGARYRHGWPIQAYIEVGSEYRFCELLRTSADCALYVSNRGQTCMVAGPYSPR